MKKRTIALAALSATTLCSSPALADWTARGDGYVLMIFPLGFSPITLALASWQAAVTESYDFRQSPYADTMQRVACGNSYGARYELPYGRYSGDGLLTAVAVDFNNGSIVVGGEPRIEPGEAGGWSFAAGSALIRQHVISNAAVGQHTGTSQSDVYCDAVTRYMYLARGKVLEFTRLEGETPCHWTLEYQIDPHACTNTALTPDECWSGGGKRFWSTEGQVLLTIDDEANERATLRWPDGFIEHYESGPISRELYRELGDSFLGAHPKNTLFANGLRIVRRVDSDGNETKFSYDDSGNVSAIRDAHARRTVFERNGGQLDAIHVDGIGGNVQTYRLGWSDFAWTGSHFFQGQNWTRTYKTLTSFTLPDGGVYTFDYRFPDGRVGFGNITQITTPDGAVETFEYGASYVHPTPGDWNNANCPMLTQQLNRFMLSARTINFGTSVERTELAHEQHSVRDFFNVPHPDHSRTCAKVFWGRETRPDGTMIREAICGASPPFAGRVLARETWAAGASGPFEATYFGDPDEGRMWAVAERISVQPYTTGDYRQQQIAHVKDGIRTIERFQYEMDFSRRRITGNVAEYALTLEETVQGEEGPVTYERQISRTTTSYLHTPAYDARNLIRLPRRSWKYDAFDKPIEDLEIEYDTETLVPLPAGNLIFRSPDSLAVFDEAGNELAGTRAARGNPTRRTRHPVAPTREDIPAVAATVEVMKYYENGLVFSTVDALRREWRTESGSHQHCVGTPILETAGINPLGHMFVRRVDCFTGVELSVEDPNQNLTCKQYDRFGRLLESASPGDRLSNIAGGVRDPRCPVTDSTVLGSNGRGPTIWYDYADADRGKYELQRVETRTKNGSALGHLSVRFYDAAGRTIQDCAETDPATHGGESTICDYATYDSAGRISKKYVSFFADPQPFVQHPSPELLHTHYAYDAFGRIESTELIGSGQPPTRYTYGADPARALTETQVIDPLGDVSITRFNVLGQAVELERYGAECEEDDFSGNGVCRTTYEYDVAGKLLSYRSPRDKTKRTRAWTRFDYDGLGRLTRAGDSDRGVWIYELDAAGNLKKQTDPTGAVLELTFDALDRVIERKATTAATAELGSFSDVETYFYDGRTQ